eukprot:scaffold7316_cov123-Cylindrotheca_fusiformis.AAC.5
MQVGGAHHFKSCHHETVYCVYIFIDVFSRRTDVANWFGTEKVTFICPRRTVANFVRWRDTCGTWTKKQSPETAMFITLWTKGNK